MYDLKTKTSILNWREEHRDEWNAYMKPRNKLYYENNKDYFKEYSKQQYIKRKAKKLQEKEDLKKIESELI
jgi:hypothetical protein